MLRWLGVVLALGGMMAFAACGGEEQAPQTPAEQMEEMGEEAGEAMEEMGEEMEEAAEEMGEAAEGAAERMQPAEKEGPGE